MALIRLDHLPESIKVNLPLFVLIPNPGQMGNLPVSQRKVLYLLHGLSDDGSAWQRFTTIEVIAEKYGLVVVMPSIGRSFYTDQLNGQKYFSYLTEELPLYLKSVFGLAPRREDTLIAGNSMGGYGAFKAALTRPELYSASASLSGVLATEFISGGPHDPKRVEFPHIFGDLDKLPGSEYDPLTWLKRAARDPKHLPKLYMSCGRQDDLYPANLAFHSACQALGITIEYHEADGYHDWSFWNSEIQLFLAAHLEPQ